MIQDMRGGAEMFSREKIRELASEYAYMQGIQIESSGWVRNAVLMKARGQNRASLTCVQGFVRDEQPVFRDTRVYLYEGSGEYYNSTCECGSRYSFTGTMCRHCVALMLYYNRQEESLLKQFQSGAGADQPNRKTDSGLSVLLQKHGQKELLSLKGDSAAGQVQLEPTLHLGSGKANLTLRIGMDRMYIVQDIYALAQRVRDRTEFSYGKQLTFIHRAEAFDAKSRPLMEFLLRQTENARDYGLSNRGRQLPLSYAQIDEFLSLEGCREGVLVDRGQFGGGTVPMTLSDEPARQELMLIGKEGGAELQYTLLPRLQTRRYNYYLDDHTIRRRPRSGQEEDELEDYLYGRRGTEKAFIAQEDLPLFVRDLLPVIEQNYTVRTRSIDLDQYQPEEADFQIYLDLPQDDMITIDPVAVYGEGRVYHVLDGNVQKGNRNAAQEMEMRALIDPYCNAMDSGRYLAVAAGDEDLMYRLLTEGISKFREAAEVYLSDRLRRIAEVPRPGVVIGVSLSGDLLNLTLSSEGMSLEELASVLSRYDRKKKFIRLKGGEFLSMEDESLNTLAQIKKGLSLTEKDLAKGELTMPKFRALYLDSQLQGSEEISVEKSRDFRALIRQMHTIEDSDCEIPASLSGVLREYQKTGYRWMETLCANGFGGILADDMGLGKTLQVIAFLAAHYDAGSASSSSGNSCGSAGAGALPEKLRTLIVCPASLVYNWENEFHRFAPGLPVRTIAGSAQERHMMLSALPPQVILITSYDLLKRDQEFYAPIPFNYEFIDEAQFIKNAGTQAAKAVKSVNSSFRMALTGTPVENRLSELWSIFDYLMPGYLYSYEKFRREIETPVVQNGDADALARVQKMIAPFVLRRLKKDVLKDLPDKIERGMVARMEKEQKELYEAHVQRLKILLDKQTPAEFDRSKIQILAELTKLRQLCCDPSLLYEGYKGGSAKLDLCMELVQNAVEGGHKILLFSQFTSMLDIIAGALEEKGIRYYMLTGATPKTERMRLVNTFNAESSAVPVFCISLKAGGTGLNLTAADIVIHYDPWWNTAAQNQATDRTHRIGQKNVVNVYKLIAQDTIEDNIVKLQERKQELADQVLGGSDVAAPTFNKEELLELLAGAE